MSSPIAENGPVNSGALTQRTENDVARRKAGIAKWRRRSRDIHMYRKLLPALIGVICLILAGYVLYNTVAWRLSGADTNNSVAIRMVNPKFYGRDSSNSPYVGAARSALRDERDFQRVVLDQPHFVLNQGAVNESTLQSAAGVYREDTGILHLEKDLIVTDKRGYNFKSQRAVVDTKTGAIKGESPIDGVGPLGRISSSSYAVTPGGVQFFFRGNVRTRIDRPSAPR